MPGMDRAALATWLGGIGLLDPTQGGQAFQQLTLAEANDPIEYSDHPIEDDAAALGAAEAAPSIVAAKTLDTASGEDLLSKIGRDRIASFGCPHCGGDAVRPWGR